MTLHRALIAFILTGLLSGAGMAAQAQTGIRVRIGTPEVAVVANYAPRYQGAGSVGFAGFFNGARWNQGHWAQRVDSRYREQNHYSDRNVRIDDYGRNVRDGNYRDGTARGSRNDQKKGRNENPAGRRGRR